MPSNLSDGSAIHQEIATMRIELNGRLGMRMPIVRDSLASADAWGMSGEEKYVFLAYHTVKLCERLTQQLIDMQALATKVSL